MSTKQAGFQRNERDIAKGIFTLLRLLVWVLVRQAKASGKPEGSAQVVMLGRGGRGRTIGRGLGVNLDTGSD